MLYHDFGRAVPGGAVWGRDSHAIGGRHAKTFYGGGDHLTLQISSFTGNYYYDLFGVANSTRYQDHTKLLHVLGTTDPPHYGGRHQFFQREQQHTPMFHVRQPYRATRP